MSPFSGLSQIPLEQIANWLSEGSIVPCLGAGASTAGMPAETALPQGRGLAAELAAFMGASFPGGAAYELAAVAQFFEGTVFDRPALYDFLHYRLEVSQANCYPGDVATTLATMPKGGKPHFIVTTNYDTTLERAFKLAGAPLCVITQNMRDPEYGASRVHLRLPDGQVDADDAMTFQASNDTRFPPDCTFLYKMHGSVHSTHPDWGDDVIITEDDYISLMVNAGGAISSFFPPPALAAAFKRRRFLFLGYSMRDWNFRFLGLLNLRGVLSRKGRLRHWAIQLSPEPLEIELWRQRNVTAYSAKLEDFCDGLKAVWSSRPPET